MCALNVCSPSGGWLGAMSSSALMINGWGMVWGTQADLQEEAKKTAQLQLEEIIFTVVLTAPSIPALAHPRSRALTSAAHQAGSVAVQTAPQSAPQCSLLRLKRGLINGSPSIPDSSSLDFPCNVQGAEVCKELDVKEGGSGGWGGEIVTPLMLILSHRHGGEQAPSIGGYTTTPAVAPTPSSSELPLQVSPSAELTPTSRQAT
jgi:hypothetical protein